MKRFQMTSIIRDRGQLTIPESIRKLITWTAPLSAVTISVERADEIIITPHADTQKVNWNAIWGGIHLARSFQGKNETKSARELINADRESR